ncbi:MAG: hypothetical protein DMF85_03350 [Acidobacteria bacterium]|nr:MAG: hypothetical protein DMF85_03350 [Acidobacteriota bacterium]
MRARRTAGALLACAIALGSRGAARPPAQAPSAFGKQIAALSERGGYFDTDNLISNESSYLQVLPDLRRRNVRGGAYVGVGPDQNFTYIGETRPTIAFIVDIRRDNLLLHLLFKALFHVSRTRVEYLAQLFGRPIPADVAGWRAVRVDRLAQYIDEAQPAAIDRLRARLDDAIGRFGVPLSRDDYATIDRFHRRFIDSGLSLRFQSTGRPPQSYYPTYRDLLVDTDGAGRQAHFLASDDAFQFVRSLEERDLVVPVVGDLGGQSALIAIGRLLATRRERLTAFYTSNVEFYLDREGTFARFTSNLSQIPHSDDAVVIRAIFRGYAYGAARTGDSSVSRLQRIDDLLAGVAAGRIRGYWDLLR